MEAGQAGKPWPQEERFSANWLLFSMRSYSHLHNDVTTLDEEGVELASAEAALRHAQDEAMTMAAESVRQEHHDLSHYIELTDYADACLFKVTFMQVVDVVG
jgi:hypothetical protein